MSRVLALLLCSILFLSSTGLEAKTTVQEEYRNILWKIAQNIHHYYFEEIPPDTLMHAGVRGIFKALDPASDYTFTNSVALENSAQFVSGIWL